MRKLKIKSQVSAVDFAKEKIKAQTDYIDDFFSKEIARLLNLVQNTDEYRSLSSEKQSDFFSFFEDFLGYHKDALYVWEYAVKLKKELKEECNPLKNENLTDTFPYRIQVKIARYFKWVILTPSKLALIQKKLSQFFPIEIGKYTELPVHTLWDVVTFFNFLSFGI